MKYLLCGNLSDQFVINNNLNPCPLVLYIGLPVWICLALSLGFSIFKKRSRIIASTPFSAIFYPRYFILLLETLGFISLSLFISVKSDEYSYPQFITLLFLMNSLATVLCFFDDILLGLSCFRNSQGSVIFIFCKLLTIIVNFIIYNSLKLHKFFDHQSLISNSLLVMFVFDSIYIILRAPIIKNNLSSLQVFQNYIPYRNYGWTISHFLFNSRVLVINAFNNHIINSSFLPPLPKVVQVHELDFEKDHFKDIGLKETSYVPLLKYFSWKLKTQIILICICLIVSNCLQFLLPLTLNKFIASIVSYNIHDTIFYGLSLIGIELFQNFNDTANTLITSILNSKGKLLVSSLLFKSALYMKKHELQAKGKGNLINVLTSDCEKFSRVYEQIINILSVPLKVIISLSLLFYTLGYSGLVGVGFLVIILPIVHYVATRIKKSYTSFTNYRDERVKIMMEILPNMLQIKMLRLEKLIYSRVEEKRNLEMKYLRIMKYFDAICVLIWVSLPSLLFASTFSTFVLIGNKLSAPILFTGISVLNMLIWPMNALPWILNGLMESLVSIKRLNDILVLKNRPNVEDDTHMLLPNSQDPSVNPDLLSNDDTQLSSQANQSDFILKLSGLDIYDQEDKVILKNVNLEVNRNELIVIAGRTGSGKSCLLLGLLSQLKTNHQVIRGDIKISFCPQTPWILNASLKENIQLLDNPSKSSNQLLEKVLEIVCLDFEVKNQFQNGLQYHCDESRLSGGQKSRINLARCIYQIDSDIIILDDPFCSLDSVVSKKIFFNLFNKENGFLLGKSIILTTNRSFKEFTSKREELSGLSRFLVLENGSLSEVPLGKLLRENLTEAKPSEDQPMKAYQEETTIPTNTNDEELFDGEIDASIVKSYVSPFGTFIGFVLIFSLAAYQIFQNGSEYWLSYWIQSLNPNATLHNTLRDDLLTIRIDENTKYYLSTYAGLIGILLVFIISRSFLFAYATLISSKKLHTKYISRLLLTRLQYFDDVSDGNLVNRFSCDMNIIDDNLPFLINIVLSMFVSLLGTLIIIAIVLPNTLIVIIPLTFAYSYIQYRYRSSARNFKRVARSLLTPLLSHTSETIKGLPIIQGIKEQGYFYRQFRDKLIDCEKGNFAVLLGNFWLSIRLDILGICVLTFVVFSIAILLKLDVFINEIVFAGLAVTYSLDLSSQMNRFLNVFIDTEKTFISMERCEQMEQGMPVEIEKIETDYYTPVSKENMEQMARTRRKNWLSQLDKPEFETIEFDVQGSLAMKNVFLCLKNKKMNKEVKILDNITLNIESGERVAIVGRTGSGKSSFLKSITRIFDILPGPVNTKEMADRLGFFGVSGEISINNVDIRKIPLQQLREIILMITQDTFFFNGTVRKNIDTTEEFTDSQIRELMRRCSLSDDILDKECGDCGSYLSQGEKQMISIARAVLIKRSRLNQPQFIFLDEPTANVDSTNERIIFDLLLEEFPNSTLLMITHNVEILQSLSSQQQQLKVIVFENGSLKEFDTFENLSHKEDSQLSALLKSANAKEKN